MYLLVFIAGAWGTTNGGINSLNYDLARACADYVHDKENIKICCVIPGLNESDLDEIEDAGIIPITMSHNVFKASEKEIVKFIHQEIAEKPKLRHYYPQHCNVICVGHDIYSGKISFALAKKSSGKNIVFHHMDYESYYLFKNKDSIMYKQKIIQQKNVLKKADLVFAVGPKLYASAADKVTRKKVEIFYPGLSDFKPVKELKIRFRPLVFGRVEKSNVRVKQTELAISAFAKAISMDSEIAIIGNDPMLTVVGYDISDPHSLEDEVNRLQIISSDLAGRLCNVVPMPFVSNRKDLEELITNASVVMMLSFHEGFGLVGLEAIAAGVPLIISENTGLYQFLVEQKLNDFVYHLEIKGSTNEEGYCQEDLEGVSQALRTIRNKESYYKERALYLRNALSNHTWIDAAKGFIDVIRNQYSDEDDNHEIFFRPEQLTRLQSAIANRSYSSITHEVIKNNKKIYYVTGKCALASIYMMLLKNFTDYAIRIYDINSETNNDKVCSEFLNDCYSFFSMPKDNNGPGFKYLLCERLDKTIIILNNFEPEMAEKFFEIFSILSNSEHDFFVYLVMEKDALLSVDVYNYENCSNMASYEQQNYKYSSIPEEISEETKVLYKALCFRKKKEYSKKLINFICKETNKYYIDEKNSSYFFDNLNYEEKLIQFGLIEEYSISYYQNNSKYIKAFEKWETNDIAYLFVIYSMGKYYARNYSISKNRSPQIENAYFSCKCFEYCLGLNSSIQDSIKQDYERIIFEMRKNAMDYSDYGRYISVIQNYLDKNVTPKDPWIWYIFYHCKSIYEPSLNSLNDLKAILNTKIPKYIESLITKEELIMQLKRICVELESELEIDDSFDSFIELVKNTSKEVKKTTTWSQCLSTIITISISQKKYDVAEFFLKKYKERISIYNLYPSVISTALEAELILSKNNITDKKEQIIRIIPQIKKAYNISKNKLRDYRAQGWTLGLMGECQLKVGDNSGERKIVNAIKTKKNTGEKTKTYRNWLKRISVYHLQNNTKTLVGEELERITL